VIRIVLPFHLRTLARIDGELHLDLPAPVTIQGVLAEIERQYPMLRGTIREHGTLKRRPFIRFFACREDFSDAPPEAVLPEAIVRGDEPLMIVGAMAGG